MISFFSATGSLCTSTDGVSLSASTLAGTASATSTIWSERKWFKSVTISARTSGFVVYSSSPACKNRSLSPLSALAVSAKIGT